MKCVKYKTSNIGLHNKIKRVSDKEAIEFVNSGKWEYCPKHEWKELINTKDKPEVRGK
jgi:hypothetical protein